VSAFARFHLFRGNIHGRCRGSESRSSRRTPLRRHAPGLSSNLCNLWFKDPLPYLNVFAAICPDRIIAFSRWVRRYTLSNNRNRSFSIRRNSAW
jgi:hypothetical protein